MKKRLVLIVLVLLGVGNVFFIKKSKADPNGGVPAQIAKLQATVDALKDSVAHIDPAVIGETTLTTGMLYFTFPKSMACNVVNASEKTVIVSISVVWRTGDVLLNKIVTLAPHEAVMITDEETHGAPAYCRFNFSGAPNDIRANGAIRDDPSAPDFKVVTDAR
jgi:hypothetical protein